MLKVEGILYIYGAVCVCMIVFNGMIILVNRRRAGRLHKKNCRFDSYIRRQTKRLRGGLLPEEGHGAFMYRKLRHVNNLLAFEMAMDGILAADKENGSRYMKWLYPVFIRLSVYYKKKDVMYLTCFLYVLRKYQAVLEIDGRLNAFLLELLQTPGVSCRDNVMHIIYGRGEVSLLLRALLQLDKSEVFWHPKLIHDGLLHFAGDKEKLLHTLWDSFEEFQPPMQVTLLNFMRLLNGDSCARVLQLLVKDGQDDEVCFACIRYFGKYYYAPALPLLTAYVRDEGKRRWEYAAVAAAALAIYRGGQVTEVLRGAIDSPNWHVRNNAACSLQAMGLGYRELADTIDKSSRYAREIMQYWLDYREVKRGEKDE